MAEKEVTLLDVIDRAQLQSLQDAFAKATGMAALATDKSGPVTQLSCPTDFCMNYTRKSSVGCERCNLCDLKGGEQASRTGKPAVYYCHGGLVDFASPIIVNGKQIGSLIGGQVLTEEPDLDKFRAIAKEIDVDPDEYVEAVKKVPISIPLSKFLPQSSTHFVKRLPSQQRLSHSPTLYLSTYRMSLHR